MIFKYFLEKFFMNNKSTELIVKKLYEKYPYPLRKIKNKNSLKKYVNWVTKIFFEKNDYWKNKNVLELGCGTGELANGLSLAKANVIGIDFSKTSLKKANNLKKRFKTNAKFIEKNILELNLNKKFDVVIALGSLHHTIDAKKGFIIGKNHLKKNGIIIVGFYNKFSRLRHRIKRIILYLLAKNDFEKRINIGKKIFGDMKSQSWLADKYGQPHESYHSINQILNWFNEENIEFISSKPKFQKPIIDELKWLLKKQNAFFVMVGRKK